MLYFPDMDYQDADDKAFEKLNNAPSRIYANMTPRLQSPPNNGMYENTNNIMNIPKSVSPSDCNKILWVNLCKNNTFCLFNGVNLYC
jgi:hypothetical protein